MPTPTEYAGLTRAMIDNFHGLHVSRGELSCERWRANGQLKTWKRNPDRFVLPIKHGLYNYHRLTEYDLGNRTLYAFTGADTDRCPFCGATYF